MGKFTVGHCIKSIISLILPAGEPLKPFLLFYILFETEAGPAVKRVYKLGLYSPTESAMTKQLIKAGQRILGYATAKGKHPLKVDHLKALQDKFAYATLVENTGSWQDPSRIT